jgi:hypothetical protein
MILPRKDFASMISFMLPVIPTEEKTGKNCLFVKIEEGKFIFTAGGEHCVKRVVLIAQTDMVELAECRNKKIELPESFMIPRGALKAFAEVLKDHKSICKKLGKDDQTHNFISIDHEEMESIGEFIHFKQPKFQFKELQPFFETNKEGAGESIIMSGEIENAMTGFSKTKIVEASYCSMGSGSKKTKLIHFMQEETGYEAVFICPSEVEKTKKKKGQGEQEEF